MPKLTQATVYRAAGTVREFRAETRDIDVYAAGQSVSFEFLMPSAGGGSTFARVQFTEPDLAIVLDQMLMAFGAKAAVEMARQLQVYLETAHPTAAVLK